MHKCSDKLLGLLMVSCPEIRSETTPGSWFPADQPGDDYQGMHNLFMFVSHYIQLMKTARIARTRVTSYMYKSRQLVQSTNSIKHNRVHPENKPLIFLGLFDQANAEE